MKIIFFSAFAVDFTEQRVIQQQKTQKNVSFNFILS